MQEGMDLICFMCWYGKGQSNGLANLRRPYNEEKWDSHAGGGEHKSNVSLWNYWLEREKRGSSA